MSGTENPTPEVVTHAGGAATATVSTDSVQPPATDEGGELLAGKFKTQDDLVKAYGELEKKLGQPSQQPAEETPAEDETTASTEETPEGNEAETNDETPAGDSPYGEAVTDALSKAGLDPTAVAEEFTAEGAISEATYSKLAEAGYPREMVDAYRRGVQAQDESTAAISEAQIGQIKDLAGGEQAFADMQQWMGQNLDEDALAPYNEAVSSGDFAKASKAVSDMRAKYVAEVGIEGNLMGGKTAQAEAGYTSEAEMLEDMAKPEYKTSEAFRAKVATKIAASSNVMITR